MAPCVKPAGVSAELVLSAVVGVETTNYAGAEVEGLKTVWKYLCGKVCSGPLATSTCACNSDLDEGAFSLQPGCRCWLCC